MKRIKSLPLSLRPREKLLKYGAQILTVTELLSVILVTGTKKQPVSKIATRVAQKITKTSTIPKTTLLDLAIGPAKVAQLLAVLELSHRLHTQPNSVTITKIEEVVAHAHEIMHAEKEMLLCLYLNARQELLKKEVIAIGSLNRVNLLPRELFSLIKELPVAAIILVHNHPSGNLEPSKDDLLFTERIRQAGAILGVKLLDHLIVSSQGWKQISLS